MKAKFSRTCLSGNWITEELLDEVAGENNGPSLFDRCCQAYNQGITVCNDTKCDKIHQIWETMIDKRNWYRKPCKKYLKGFCKAGKRCGQRHNDKMSAYLNYLEQCDNKNLFEEQTTEYLTQTPLYRIVLLIELKLHLNYLYSPLINIVLDYTSITMPQQFKSYQHGSYLSIDDIRIWSDKHWNQCGLCLIYDIKLCSYTGYYSKETQKIILLCANCDKIANLESAGYWKGNRPVNMHGRRTCNLYIDHLRDKLKQYSAQPDTH